MSRSFGPPVRSKSSPQEARSQLAMELMLTVYALVGAVVVLRSLLLAIGVNNELWIGGAVYGASSLLAAPLSALPGSSFELVGNLTVSDVTLLAGVVLFPIVLLLVGRRYGKFRAN